MGLRMDLLRMTEYSIRKTVKFTTQMFYRIIEYIRYTVVSVSVSQFSSLRNRTSSTVPSGSTSLCPTLFLSYTVKLSVGYLFQNPITII